MSNIVKSRGMVTVSKANDISLQLAAKHYGFDELDGYEELIVKEGALTSKERKLLKSQVARYTKEIPYYPKRGMFYV